MFFEDYLKTEKSSPKTLCEKNQNTKGKNVYIKKIIPILRRDSALWEEIQPNVKQSYFQVVRLQS